MLKSLLAHLIAYWNSVHQLDPLKSPLYLQNTIFYIMILVKVRKQNVLISLFMIIFYYIVYHLIDVFILIYFMFYFKKWQKCKPSLSCLPMLLPNVNARQICSILTWINDLFGSGDGGYTLVWDNNTNTSLTSTSPKLPDLYAPPSSVLRNSALPFPPRHSWAYKLAKPLSKQSPVLAEPIKKILLSNMKLFGRFYPILFPPEPQTLSTSNSLTAETNSLMDVVSVADIAPLGTEQK